jgi:hypothetical protein
MDFDLRYPIGWLLTSYGVILAVEGALARSTILGLNVNLYWGVFMTACGLAALVLARRRPDADRHAPKRHSPRPAARPYVARDGR